jgi:hypothetical protein
MPSDVAHRQSQHAWALELAPTGDQQREPGAAPHSSLRVAKLGHTRAKLRPQVASDVDTDGKCDKATWPIFVLVLIPTDSFRAHAPCMMVSSGGAGVQRVRSNDNPCGTEAASIAEECRDTLDMASRDHDNAGHAIVHFTHALALWELKDLKEAQVQYVCGQWCAQREQLLFGEFGAQGDIVSATTRAVFQQKVKVRSCHHECLERLMQHHEHDGFVASHAKLYACCELHFEPRELDETAYLHIHIHIHILHCTDAVFMCPSAYCELAEFVCR